MTYLVDQLLLDTASRSAGAPALTFGERTLTYGELAHLVQSIGSGLVRLGIRRGERVAFYLEKRFETVAFAFGAAHAGAVFVPVNPLLKPEQVAHIVRDCSARVIVTSGERVHYIAPAVADCPDLSHVVVAGTESGEVPGKQMTTWDALVG
jgi:acyl-CoA synthetase (AMP-forming)/AMP-acid ligase II